MKTRLLIISIAVIASFIIPAISFSYFDQNILFSGQCIEGRNSDGICSKSLPVIKTESNKYTAVFDEGSPLEEIGTGNAVLTEDNCHRYAYWLTKYQKEKLDHPEDYPKSPPWGNQIFPLVNYCTTSGNLVKTINNSKIQWEFQIKNEN